MKRLIPALLVALTLAGSAVRPGHDSAKPAAQPALRHASPLNPGQLARARVLRDVLAEAGNLTARVALAPNRAGRIDAARDAAARMRGLVDFAHWASGGATWHVQVLHNLADALDRYDLTQIALLSDQRADAVIALELQLAPVLGTAPEIRAQEGGS